MTNSIVGGPPRQSNRRVVVPSDDFDETIPVTSRAPLQSFESTTHTTDSETKALATTGSATIGNATIRNKRSE
jgi:hypothetical protein